MRMKKASIINYAFARDWPAKAYFGAWVILGIVTVVLVCEPSPEMFKDWRFGVFFIVSLLVAPLFFAALSLISAPGVIFPLYCLGRWLAGGPFQVGDRVRILIGPHRERVVEVYEVWESRCEVRVRLDAKAEKEVRDVFSFTQVFRESPKQCRAGEPVAGRRVGR